MYDVEYRILACCRNGCVYSIKRDMKTVTKATIELSSHAVGMAKVGKQVAFATGHLLFTRTLIRLFRS